MIQVLSGVWALLTGIVLIMLGNGMQSTLVGLREEAEARGELLAWLAALGNAGDVGLLPAIEPFLAAEPLRVRASER